jgi:carbamoyltransferase
MARYYIGLSAGFHDTAIAIVAPDGEVLFAEATERYLQDKRGFNSPPDHIFRSGELVERHCPPDADLVLAVSWSHNAVDAAAFSALEHTKLGKTTFAPIGDLFDQYNDYQAWPLPNPKALRSAMSSGLTLAGNNLLYNRAIGNETTIEYFDHHTCHAAFGCASSPFEEAACLVVDGYGEGTSVAFFRYADGEIKAIRPAGAPSATANPASLGGFYAVLCALCGLDALKGEEWKVMGLAAYGKFDQACYDALKPLIAVDGLDLICTLSPSAHRRLLQDLATRVRAPGSSPLEAADIARTGQEIFAETMRELLSNFHAAAPSDNLVLVGGCALNSSFNGRILAETPFTRLHVPSAPADDGNAIGAALLACHAAGGAALVPRPHAMTPFLGSEIRRETLENLIRFGGTARLEHLPGRIAQRTAELLAQSKVVGWMQGRAEFGPRALGNRSILADPRHPDMRDILNSRVKFREEFRPFAPAILHEHGPDYFEHYQDSPYMERAQSFRRNIRHRVPAVVHEDGTGRAQSVTAERNPRFHELITAFHLLTEVPILLNTSFNVMGKPIIHSIEDALAVFFTSGLDALVIDDYLIEK